MINDLLSKIYRLIQRARYSEVDNVKTPKTTMRIGSTRAEYIQDWGFISVPPESATGEALLVYPYASKSNGVVVKATDPLAIPKGFVAGDTGLFNNAGVVIKLSGKSVTITGAENIDFGEATQKLVNESFLKVFDTHTHTAPSGATGVPLVPSTDANKTITVGAE